MNGAAHIAERAFLDRSVLQSRAWAYPAYVLFFLMLFVPTVYKPVKAVFVVATVLVIVAAVLQREGRLRVDARILFWTWLLTLAGLGFIVLGAVRGHPGALSVSTVFVIWPWLYLLYTAGASREWLVRGLLRVLVIGLIAIDIYTAHFILHRMGIWPSSLYVELELDQAIGFYTGFVEYRLLSIDSLIYLIPFAIGALFAWPTDSASMDMPVRRIWLWLGLIVGLGLMILSGRRALILVVGLAPFFALAFRSQLPGATTRISRRAVLFSVAAFVAVMLSVFWYLQATYGISFYALREMFLAGFDWQGNASASVRASQFKGLIAAWIENPIFGTGAGADVGATRVAEDPWSYELQYFAMLAHTGIVGVLLYAAAIGWIYVHAIKLIRLGTRLSFYMVPVMVGTTCFLTANGTNQYLGKYDFMWTIFLPLILINMHLLRTSDEDA